MSPSPRRHRCAHFRCCAISGFARREAREAFTLEARATGSAPGLGGRVHDPDTLSSYRFPRARGPGTSRVPEPAPLRVRSRRGLSRTVRISRRPRRGTLGDPRTVVARAPRRPARQTLGVVSFELGRACPWVCREASRRRRVQRCVRSTFALRNRSNSSTRASSLPSAAARPARRLATPHEDCPRSGDLAATVLVPANVSFAHRARPSEDARSRTPGGSGPPDANEAGESSVFTTGLSLRRSVGAPGRRDSSSASSRHRSPLTSLSPPPSRSRGLAFHRAPCVGPEAAKTGFARAS